MVAIPQAVDQPANADQLETISVGLRLRTDPSGPAEIQDAIFDLIANPQVRLRLNIIRDELRRGGGPDQAADAVQDVASGRW